MERAPGMTRPEEDITVGHTAEFVFDVVGMGLNAVDHICLIPRFPRYEEKLKMDDFTRAGGGQVASALVACSRWGLKTKYIGKVELFFNESQVSFKNLEKRFEE